MTEIARPPLLLFDLTKTVIGAFYDTYNELVTLGAGFPESVARRALAITIQQTGLKAIEEPELHVWFRGQRIAKFKPDIVVDDKLIVEVKATSEIEDFHRAQLLHYLKATDVEVGLIVNFGREPQFKRRVYQNSRKLRHFAPPSPEALEREFSKPDA